VKKKEQRTKNKEQRTNVSEELDDPCINHQPSTILPNHSSDLSVESLHRQAREMVMQNQMADACDKLIHAMQLSPESSGVRSDLGWVQYQLGQARNAEHLWLKALDLDPQNTTARRNLADYYFESRELDSAQSHYEELLDALGDQADPELLDGLADVYAGLGLEEKAIPLYKRVLHAVPAASAVRAKLEQIGSVMSNK
jgi:Flp pilus assembly protein TadD